MAITKSEKIWMNGELIPWDDAKVHVMAHVMHYGSSVFEGIRAYATSNGPAIFRQPEHVRRLFDSAKILRMEIPYSAEEVTEAMRAIVRANKHDSCYIRPLAYRGYGEIGVSPLNNPVEVIIATIAWGRYLGPEAIEQGVDVQVSSWTRMAPNTFPALCKAGANYLNSQLVKMEAILGGYIEGIVLDTNGYVSEGSGENIFVIRDGIIFTPPLGNSILGGITRDSAIVLAKDLGYEVREQAIPREMLYIADEVFFTGTAAEITPIRSVDKITIGAGKRGPITEKLQQEFFGITEGSLPDRHGWLYPVND